MSTLFDDSPVDLALRDVLRALEAGDRIDDSRERQVVDLKEEHGRRDKSGAIGPSNPHNEVAAKELAAAAACMANTPGGGALLVGVSNDGELIGTDLDVDWLRHRLYELTGKKLTTEIRVHTVDGARLLAIRCPQAVEPIMMGRRITWRVGTNCVDVDAPTWHARRMAVLNYDWSSEPSTVALDKARPAALDTARDFLRQSQEPHALELADLDDTTLLRRLNVVTPEGFLTNAGVLAFVGRGEPCLDYVRREHAGGDSLQRVRRSGRALLEELNEVFTALELATPLLHTQQGLVMGQQREIPLRAAREAIVNGVAHREWAITEPTLVEHVGAVIRVVSPGGFVEGVTADNIITHPSRSRNRSLTEVLAKLRIAEREGVGVDRMVVDMVRRGHPAPEIGEIPGPNVQVTLTADEIDQPWIAWLKAIHPATEADDLNSLLILRRLVDGGWVDALRAAFLIQDTPARAKSALTKLSRAAIDDAKVLQLLQGVPDAAEPVWVLSRQARAALRALDRSFQHPRPPLSREGVARQYAEARGRISSTELGGLVHADSTNMGGVLKALCDQGVLEPAWPSRRGKGFHYVFATG